MESPLAARAEAAIRRLRDVDGVSVRAEGDDVTEIHVVTSSRRSPKQIVRDVQAVLRTDLALVIDHRIVSVALARAAGAGQAGPAAEPAGSRPDAPAPRAAAPAPRPAPPASREAPEPPATDDRIR